VIIKAIQDQLSDFQAHTTDLVLDDDIIESFLRGRLDEREKAWWDKWRKELPTIAKRPKEALVTGRKRRKVEASKARNPDAPATVADIEVDEKEQQEEMRILIRVCIAPCTSCREAEADT
jgi:hypothetical protein